jgi:hypothetical protein
VNLPKVTSKQTSNKQEEIQVNDKNNRERDTRDTRMYSLSSYIVKESTSKLEICGTTKDTNVTNTPYLRRLHKGLGELHNLIGGSQQQHQVLTHND